MHLVCPSCGRKNRVPDQRLDDGPVVRQLRRGADGSAAGRARRWFFGAFVEGTELPVLVDYWADWCGPCQTMAPQFAAAAQQLPDVRFAKVDTERSPQASVRHRIRSIPTMVLFHRGQEVARCSGALPAAGIVSWVRSQLR